MKKWILAMSAVAMLAPVAGWAQGDMLFSIKAGVNLADQSTDIDPAPETSMKIGAIGGVGFTAGLSDMFGIRAEMLYSQKGTKWSSEGVDAELTMNYIDVPVTAVLMLPGDGVKPHFFAGPAFGFKMGDAKYSVNGEEQEAGEDDGYTGMDIGLTLGAGISFPMGWNSLGIDARYTLGLTNIRDDKDGTLDVPNVKNNVISIMLSYTLNLSKP
jgi:hypothetical protein